MGQVGRQGHAIAVLACELETVLTIILLIHLVKQLAKHIKKSEAMWKQDDME